MGHPVDQYFRGCHPNGSDGFDPASLICKMTEADGRPAVKLSDNFSKATGLRSEIARYRRVFGTAGVANILSWSEATGAILHAPRLT